jgi:Sec-independent protein secretion pathway component TatC
MYKEFKLYQYHSYELKFRIFYLFLTLGFSFFSVFSNMEFILYKLLLPPKTNQKLSLTNLNQDPINQNLSLSEITQTLDQLPPITDQDLLKLGLIHSKAILTPEQSTSSLLNDFIFTEIFEGFFSYLILSGYFAFIFSLPIIYYTIYHFLLPGLSYTESIIFKLTFYLSLSLLFFAHFLTYFLILPYAISFFLTFQSGPTLVPLESLMLTQSSLEESQSYLDTTLTPKLSFLGKLSSWISFLIQVFTAVSLLFHFPLFLFILFLIFSANTSANVSPGYSKTLVLTLNQRLTKTDSNAQPKLEEHDLSKTKFTKPNLPFKLFQNTTFFRKLLFFTLVLLTAIFSPPDLYSQFFLFIPLFLIIELFIFSLFIYLEYLNQQGKPSKT